MNESEKNVLRLAEKNKESDFFKAHLERVKNMKGNEDEILKNLKLNPPLSEDVRKLRDEE